MGTENSSTVVGASPEAMLEMLAGVLGVKKGGRKKEKEITTTVEKSTEVQTIIVPAGMTLLEASKELKAQHDNEEQVVDAMREFEGWEWRDVLVAIKKVSEAKFGWIKGKTIQTIFGEIRPKEIDIIVEVKNNTPVTEKCFYGRFTIAAWEEAEANVGIGGKGCYVNIKIKKKYSADATKYFDTIEQHLQNNSIFKGKTVVIEGRRNEMGLDYDYTITENKAGDRIIHNEETQLVLENFVYDNIGEAGKQIYLFVGPYGNGKTEEAMKIGRKANENHKMSFFYLKDAKLFDVVLNQSKKYQPCIIFLEDVDEIGSGIERDERMNKILNTLDGLQTKGNDLTVIFTTNHPNKLAPALRRPGRIGTMIEFNNPTIETSVKIMKQYFKGVSGEDTVNFTEMATTLGDISASVIAEVCKKAFGLAAKKGGITDAIFKSSIYAMEFHIKLMKTPPEVEPEERQFMTLFKKLLFTEDVQKEFAQTYQNY